MIYTQLNRPKTIPNKNGVIFYPEYQEQLNEQGETIVVEIGKRNIYEEIQAGAEDTKLVNILKRVTTGDLSALQQKEATYVDATTMPKTLMEAQNLVIRAKSEFEKFPTEVKDLFQNNPDKYIAEMGTKEFFEKMSPYNKKMAEIEAAGTHKAYLKKVQDQAKFEKDVAGAKEAGQ